MLFQVHYTKANILLTATEPEPFVAVVGDPLISNTFYIIGEGSIIIEGVGSVREATAIMFGVYYACLLEYPKKAQCTYKFIQHEVMGMGIDGSSVPSKLANFLKQL